MTVSLIAAAAALAIGLPILALGEHIREREECRPGSQPSAPTRKDIS